MQAAGISETPPSLADGKASPTLEIDLVTMGTLVMLGRGSEFFVCNGL